MTKIRHATSIVHTYEERDAKRRKKNQKKTQQNKKKKKKKKKKKRKKKANSPQNIFGWQHHPFPQFGTNELNRSVRDMVESS